MEKTIEMQVRDLIKENGEAYILRSCTLQILHKKRQLVPDDWYRIEDNLNYIIEGVYATREEAEKHLEPSWRTFNNGVIRFVDFYTGEIAWICEDHLRQAEEDDVTIEEFLDSGDVPFESGYLGIEEFEEFLKNWLR